MILHAPRSTLFPYTTLFRSCAVPTPRWSRRDGPRYPGGAALPRAPPRLPARSSRGCSRERCAAWVRSEEHTSELQSHSDLVCRLLLEKKKKKNCKAAVARKN